MNTNQPTNPANADVILQRFAHQQQDEQEPSRSSSRLSPSDWRQMDRLIRSAVRDNAIHDGRELSASLHHLQVENKLLHDENEGLIEALKVKKEHKKKSKVLDLQQREEYHGGASFWSPQKLRETHTRQSLKEQDERERKFQKLQDRAGREAAAIYKQKIAEEKRVAREAAKRERERVRAERAEQVAERRRQREAQKQAATAAKAIQLSQRGKRAASKKRARDQKRVARAGVLQVVRWAEEQQLYLYPRQHATAATSTSQVNTSSTN